MKKICIAALLSIAAFAEEAEDLGSIDVVDQRREDLRLESLSNPYKLNPSQIAGAEIFTAEDIKNLAPKDLFDLLEKAAGVDVTYQGRRNPFFVNVRGGGSLVYILDGAILPPYFNKILQKIPVSFIEEVQVVRGASAINLAPLISASSMSGGASGQPQVGSIGGVAVGYVIIRTKRPDKTQTVVRAAGESYKRGGDLAHNESLYTGTPFEIAEGVSGYAAAAISGYNRPSKESWFDGQSGWSEMATIGVSGDKFEAHLLAYNDEGYFEMQRGKELNGSLVAAKWYIDPLKLQLFNLDSKIKWNADQITLIDIFTTRYNQTEWVGGRTFTNPYPAGAPQHSLIVQNGYSLRHNARFSSDTSLNAGYQETRANGNDYENYRSKVAGWSISVEQKLFDDALSLDLGYREDTKTVIYDKNATDTRMENKKLPSAKIFAFGVDYHINTAVEIGGRYFHSDQGLNGDLDIKSKPSAPELSGEKQTRYETSVSITPLKEFNAHITYYAIDAKNEKSVASGAGATYACGGDICYYFTESDSKRNGIETILNGAALLGEGSLDYKFSWTHTLQDKDNAGNSKLGVSRPRNLFTAMIGYGIGDWKLNASLKRQSGWKESTSSPGTAYDLELGEFTRMDANVRRSFKFGENEGDVTLFGRNIGDKMYATRAVVGQGYYFDRGRVVGVEVALKY
ncbi:MAG: TonB-dependent receptor plug domain-containing protein [Helicobacteraceae bacterium]|jgi:iron complex outermembrane receptor protein|nr:TonB-dependent receptor plug domain-containing protein [Helicobacteraceae bacterium]